MIESYMSMPYNIVTDFPTRLAYPSLTRLDSFSDVSALGYLLAKKNVRTHATDPVTMERYAGTRVDCRDTEHLIGRFTLTESRKPPTPTSGYLFDDASSGPGYN